MNIHAPRPKDMADWQIQLFRHITKIDPQKTKIKGIVVLNVKELMHVFRRIWQDFGPFPMIGCDSEGLSWNFSNDFVPIGRWHRFKYFVHIPMYITEYSVEIFFYECKKFRENNVHTKN